MFLNFVTEGSTDVKVPKKEQELKRRTQRKLIEDLGSRLGISGDNLDAWYTVTEAQILQRGGLKLGLGKRSSLYTLIKSVFPEHSWDSEKFVRYRRLPKIPTPSVFPFFTFLFILISDLISLLYRRLKEMKS
jgi:hypothetical protein